ncbi:autophagy-related 4B (yeast), isoform CRA_d [Rattus norvegicus]|uniref:Autophagy-related 4B (Yeast), isoform CRA_d n=1 Tax=Rattus norvegicus TaxID=10116 RepID=A6JR30_RAT|nr:autophagy-related 4B (yeast), isoform CRA_d [Rattus norvegicus]
MILSGLPNLKISPRPQSLFGFWAENTAFSQRRMRSCLMLHPDFGLRTGETFQLLGELALPQTQAGVACFGVDR